MFPPPEIGGVIAVIFSYTASVLEDRRNQKIRDQASVSGDNAFANQVSYVPKAAPAPTSFSEPMVGGNQTTLPWQLILWSILFGFCLGLFAYFLERDSLRRSHSNLQASYNNSQVVLKTTRDIVNVRTKELDKLVNVQRMYDNLQSSYDLQKAALDASRQLADAREAKVDELRNVEHMYKDLQGSYRSQSAALDDAKRALGSQDVDLKGYKKLQSEHASLQHDFEALQNDFNDTKTLCDLRGTENLELRDRPSTRSTEILTLTNDNQRLKAKCEHLRTVLKSENIDDLLLKVRSLEKANRDFKREEKGVIKERDELHLQANLATASHQASQEELDLVRRQLKESEATVLNARILATHNQNQTVQDQELIQASMLRVQKTRATLKTLKTKAKRVVITALKDFQSSQQNVAKAQGQVKGLTQQLETEKSRHQTEQIQATQLVHDARANESLAWEQLESWKAEVKDWKAKSECIMKQLVQENEAQGQLIHGLQETHASSGSRPSTENTPALEAQETEHLPGPSIETPLPPSTTEAQPGQDSHQILSDPEQAMDFKSEPCTTETRPAPDSEQLPPNPHQAMDFEPESSAVEPQPVQCSQQMPQNLEQAMDFESESSTTESQSARDSQQMPRNLEQVMDFESESSTAEPQLAQDSQQMLPNPEQAMDFESEFSTTDPQPAQDSQHMPPYLEQAMEYESEFPTVEPQPAQNSQPNPEQTMDFEPESSSIEYAPPPPPPSSADPAAGRAVAGYQMPTVLDSIENDDDLSETGDVDFEDVPITGLNQ